MAELGPGEEERGLWRRWRAFSKAEAPAPDALTLAAYAESRLDEAAAELVENWLAAYPEALADIAAARALSREHPYRADDAIIARASALVASNSGTVVPFRRTASGWHNALAWSSVAASLIATSLVGFALGSDAYQNLSRNQTTDVVSADALDGPPATPDLYFSDESGT
jgi:hypothetical protein